jgi:SAM-dependent methyltransferase
MSALKPLQRVQRQWTALGDHDPLWAILTRPEKRNGAWVPEDFFATGQIEINEVLSQASALSRVNFGTALDFGCGVGRLSQALSAHFERVIGIDVAAPMIEAARRFNRYPDRCEYVHNVAPNLANVACGSVDLLYSNITLQHVVPALAREYIREFFRVTRLGGLAIFQLPTRPRSLLWHWVKRVTPLAATNLLWRLRTGSPEAIESYFLAERQVCALVEKAGGTVLLVEPDDNGPPGWESRRYFCMRPS